MDKVKNFFSPGHSADDEVMYGAQPQRTSSGKLGKVSGEGSHFGSSHDAESSPQSLDPDQQATSGLSQTQSEPPQPDAKGKVAGEGSHFDSGRPTEGTSAIAPSAAKSTMSPSNPGLAEPRSSRATTGPRSTEPTSDVTPASERGNVSGAATMDTRPAEDASVTSIKSGIPGSRAQGSTMADHSHSDPAGDSHTGRDTTLGVGAGGAAAAAGKAWKPGTTSGFEGSENDHHGDMPGSFPDDDDNPYRTAHIDPRVDSKPSTSAKTLSTTTKQAPPAPQAARQQATKSGPVEKESHVGRDTGAAAAGLGAAGLGASEVARRREQKGDQAHPQEAQNYSLPVYKDDGYAKKDIESLPTRSDNKPYDTGKVVPSERDFGHEQPKQAKTGGSVEGGTQPKEDHKGRDAGILGAAAGAIGLGALVGRKSSDKDPKKEEPELAGKSATASTQIPREEPVTMHPAATRPAGLDDQRYDPAGTGKQHVTPAGTFDQSKAPLKEPSKDEHHYGRDAGLATGAVGLGAGAYEAKKPHDPSEPSMKAVQHETPKESTPKDSHHYGRDAGLATAGTGAAGLGAYEAKKYHDQPETPVRASQQQTHASPGGPPDRMSLPGHDRNTSKGTLDDATASLLARNAALEEAGSKHTNQPQTGYQDQPSKLSENTPEKGHHYGRDAGLAAGAGGLGVGAYEAKKDHDPKESQVTQRQPNQPLVGAGHSAVSQRTAKPSNYPEHGLRREGDPDESSHAGRNTALGAAGVGAGAYGAHELTRHDNKGENWPLKDTNEPQQSRYPEQGSYGQMPLRGDDRVAHEEPERQGHTARNAALGGAAVAGAGAYAGHELSQHEAEKLEKQQLADQKARQKEIAAEQAAQQKSLDKAAAKEAHQQEKQLAKEEKHAEKDAAKAEKKHEKEIAAQEKEREKQENQAQKDAAKAEKAHEQEVAALEKEREKQAKQQQKEAEEAEEAKKKHSKELEAAGVGAAAGAATAGAVHHGHPNESQERPPVDSQGNLIDTPEHRSIDSDEKKKHGLRGLLHKIAHPGEKDEERTPDSPPSSDHHDRQKLHKDPPQGFTSDGQTPAYADYPVKEGDHPGARTISGGHTAPDPANDPTRYSTHESEESKSLLEKENKFLSKHFGA